MPMKPAQTTSSTPRSASQSAIARSRALALAVVVGEREDRALDARGAGALQREGLGVARADARDRRRAPVHALDQRLQVRARARDQHAEPHGARRSAVLDALARHDLADRHASQPAPRRPRAPRRRRPAGTMAT